MESTWKERNYNSRYILEQEPDYVLFSTGTKPSAPAERALMLYPQFLHNYFTVTWLYRTPGPNPQAGEIPVYRKIHDPQPPFRPTLPAAFVNNYHLGVNSFNAGDYDRAKQHFSTALRLTADRPHLYSLYKLSLTHYRLREFDMGYSIQNRIVAIDSFMYEPHADLYVWEYMTGNDERAAIHRRWLEKLVPWKVERYDSLAAARKDMVERQMRQQGTPPPPDGE
jgi:hypothetical protein